MLLQDVLHLLGADFEAAPDDDILPAFKEGEMVFVPDLEQVPGSLTLALLSFISP